MLELLWKWKGSNDLFQKCMQHITFVILHTNIDNPLFYATVTILLLQLLNKNWTKNALDPIIHFN